MADTTEKTVADECGAVSEHGDVCGLPPHDEGLCQSNGPRKHVSSPEKAGKPWRWYRDAAVAWNTAHPVGVPVLAWPGTRDDEPLVTRTRTPAWTLGDGAAVVSVEGRAGGIALTHIQPVEASEKTACWVLTNEAGDDLEQDGAPHFASEKRAAEYAARKDAEVPPDFKPRQLDHLCVTLACSCCEYVFDEDEDGVVHWECLAEAMKGLKGFWEFTNGQAKCDACKVGPCDAEAGYHG